MTSFLNTPNYLLYLVNDDFFNLLASDCFARSVDRPLCHDDNVQPLAGVSGLGQLLAQLLGPVDNLKQEKARLVSTCLTDCVWGGDLILELLYDHPM